MEYLSIPDVILSLGSMMNMDAMAYGAVSNENTQYLPISMYIKDNITKKVLERSSLSTKIPIFSEGNGSFITSISGLKKNLEDAFFNKNKRLKKQKEAKAIYKPIKGMQKRTINLIKSIEEEC
ncbi:hypothetical protein ACS65S_13635 [Staphylococcus saprophyticus]